MNEHIHQDIHISATPETVYALLTDHQQFGQMTGGAPADIDPTAGGSFSCFGGMIVGRNIECIPGKRLVQAWRAKNWEDGLYSIVRFELQVDGDATRIAMDHSGFPEGQKVHLDQGWHANYWEPMKKAVE